MSKQRILAYVNKPRRNAKTLTIVINGETTKVQGDREAVAEAKRLVGVPCEVMQRGSEGFWILSK